MKSRRVLFLPPEAIVPNPAQPRRTFDPVALRELASSIRENGILHPLTVRRVASGWELVAGERRLRAARMAGLREVPCLELPSDADTSALLALVENLQRQDLHYLEEAAALAAFLKRTGMSQEAAAKKLGMSPSALANKLRLLRLSPECRRSLEENGLTERHARALLRLSDEQERLSALRRIVCGHWNVAQTEQYIDRRLHQLQQTPPQGRRTYIIKDVRLFLNSVDRGLRLIRDAGVDAHGQREATEDAIVLTIRIPKQVREQK